MTVFTRLAFISRAFVATMTFQPYPTRSGFIFLAIAAFSSALAIYLATLLPRQPDPSAMFKLLIALLLILGLAVLALYWALIALKLNYHLNRNGLAIQWGLAQQQRIPFESIKEIIPGTELPVSQLSGVNIAGLRLGQSQLAGYGPIKFYATAAPVDSLLIVTPQYSYLISPRQPDNFIQAWQARRTLGPTQHWPAGIRRNWPLTIPLLVDPLTWWLLGLAALACLALFGYLSLIFPQLPPSLPIHFNTFGNADRIADKSTLLMLPAAGAITLAFNGLLGSIIYRWEKVAAYLLWGNALVIQICLWVAVLTVTASGG